MTESKDLAVQTTQTQKGIYIPTNQDWKFMLDWGVTAIKSGMLPSTVKSPEAAAIIVLKGRELDLPFMTAISHIYVINGKFTMSAELIQSLARKNLPGLVINILESDDKIAKIEFIRPEKGSKPFVQSFTIEMAQAAKLTGKDVWKQYPAAMLWSRCVTAGLRKVCPEALLGVSYTPEEMGATVDGDGNVIETTGRRVETPENAKVELAQGQSIVEPVKVKSEPSESAKRAIAFKRVNELVDTIPGSLDKAKIYAQLEFQVQSLKDCSVEQLYKLIEYLESLKGGATLPWDTNSWDDA